MEHLKKAIDVISRDESELKQVKAENEKLRLEILKLNIENEHLKQASAMFADAIDQFANHIEGAKPAVPILMSKPIAKTIVASNASATATSTAVTKPTADGKNNSTDKTTPKLTKRRRVVGTAVDDSFDDVRK